MRKLGALSVALLVTMPAAAINSVVVGRGTFTNTPVASRATPVQAIMSREDRMDSKENGWYGSVQVSGFGSVTTQEQGLRDYFLPVVGQKSLLVGELGSDAYTNDGAGGALPAVNLVANYLGVLTAPVTTIDELTSLPTYQTELNFKPKQTMAGLGLQWQQTFGKCKSWWFKVNAPVVYVKNDLGMVESTPSNTGGGDVQTADGAVATITEAFQQASLLYGKIDGARHKWGVADLELMVGYNVLDEADYFLAGYVGVVTPTSNKPNSSYLWQPVTGNNKHAGFMAGSASRILWKQSDTYTLQFVVDTDGRYLFENTQVRVPDLVGRGPWSRYVWLTKEGEAFNVGSTNRIYYSGANQNIFFGPNILAQEVKVSPHAAFTMNTGLNYRRENSWEAEVGFNLYTRQTEEVKLKNAFTNPDNYFVPEISWALSNGTATESTAATIGNAMLGQPQEDYENAAVPSPLTQADLDLTSISAPAVVQTSFYGYVGTNWDNWKYPGFAGFGGEYSVNADNSAPDRWVVWGKLGVSF